MNHTVLFCERLKKVRADKELTQEKFAEIAGVTKKTQVLYEKGERQPDASYLTAIAAEGIDVLYLLTGTPAKLQMRLDTLAIASQQAAAATSDSELQRKLQEALFDQYIEKIEAERLPVRSKELLDGFVRLDETGKLAVESMINALLTKK